MKLFCSDTFDKIVITKESHPIDIYKNINKDIVDKVDVELEKEEQNIQAEHHQLTMDDVKDIQDINNAFADRIQEQLEDLSKNNSDILKNLT